MSSGLLLPRFLLGTYPEVRRAARKAAARVAEGASIADLPDAWLDLAELTGCIAAEGPKASTRGEVHYQPYVLVAELPAAFAGGDDPRWGAVFDAMLTRPWLIYGCMSQDAFHLYRTEDRARRFATAVRAQWDTLTLPGERFLGVGGVPVSFYAAARALHVCLRTLGASAEELRAGLVEPGLPAVLLERYAPA